MLHLLRGRFPATATARERGSSVDDAPRIVGLDGKRSGWLQATGWVEPGGAGWQRGARERRGERAGVGAEKELCGSMTGPDFS